MAALLTFAAHSGTSARTEWYMVITLINDPVTIHLLPLCISRVARSGLVCYQDLDFVSGNRVVNNIIFKFFNK